MNKARLKPIMFVGTGSDVGKSVINTAFCRIFLQDGYQPAPFKAQNMSLNSYATKDGLEMGRAQAVQAEACGIDCQVEMNPILLKPVSHATSQVILNGKPIGNVGAVEYFEKTDRNALFHQATQAFSRLNEQFNPIVMEGAGSISEINLWDKDIVNMRMALHTGAATYLVADIDKGGVFASVYGSLLLLPPEQKKAIRGVLINKFRGDRALFHSGRKMLEDLTGIPVVGLIPYFRDIPIEAEDSVALGQRHVETSPGQAKIAVVLLKHLSNFTDFHTLEQLPEVHLFYATKPEELAAADIVIIPGSKNTIADLVYLRSSGFAAALIQRHKENRPIYGICGGFQMMGQWVYDPDHVEGESEAMPGLGLFPVSTTLSKEKTTRQCRFTFVHSALSGEGYEIHAGSTPTNSPLCVLDTGEKDGFYLNEQSWGTYVHGIFDNESVISAVLDQIERPLHSPVNHKEQKEKSYNRLAELVRQNVDMEYMYASMR